MTAMVVNIIAVVLTLMVLSRVLGDNPIYRVAQYLFVGASLGLAFVVTYHQVLRPAAARLIAGDSPAILLYGVPLVLGILLLPRITRRQQWSWLANIPLAVVLGVGAALAIGGTIAGTLLPQLRDTARPLTGSIAQIIGALVLAFGTIIALSSFYYTARRDTTAGRYVAFASVAGHWLLMIAFGVFFAGAVQTYLSALTGRLQDLLRLIGL